MDVKCPGETTLRWYCVDMCPVGCYKITTVFSHAQTVVLCVSCSTVLAQPTGGRARLTEGMLVNIHTRLILILNCRLQFQTEALLNDL